MRVSQENLRGSPRIENRHRLSLLCATHENFFSDNVRSPVSLAAQWKSSVAQCLSRSRFSFRPTKLFYIKTCLHSAAAGVTERQCAGLEMKNKGSARQDSRWRLRLKGSNPFPGAILLVNIRQKFINNRIGAFNPKVSAFIY